MKKYILALGLAVCLSGQAFAQKSVKVKGTKIPVTRVDKKKKDNKAQGDSIDIEKIKRDAQAGNSAAMNTLGVCYYYGRQVEQDFNTAAKWWAKAIDAGNVNAIGNLGVCYKNGHGVKKDSVMAQKLFIRGIKADDKTLFNDRKGKADKGSVFDQVLMGLCYQNGHGCDKNEAKALDYFSKAANKGSLDACKIASRLYAKNNDYDKAYPLFEKAAKAGDEHAAYEVAVCKLNGKGTKKNERAGAAELQKCAEKGNVKAQIETGDLYNKGIGVTQDEEKALQWYRKASESMNPQAIWNVGLCNLKGIGTTADYHSALNWLSAASGYGFQNLFTKNLNSENEKTGWRDLDFYNYLKCLNLIYGKDKNLDQAIKELNALEKKKQKTGVKTYKALLGQAYLEKAKDDDAKSAKHIKNAIKQFQAGIKLNDPMSMYCMAELIEKGKGVEKSDKEAAKLYEKAAELGYAEAYAKMGDMYFQGNNYYDKNMREAIQCYQKAAKEFALGEEGLNRLANYYEGRRDSKTAKLYSERASRGDLVKALLKSLKF